MAAESNAGVQTAGVTITSAAVQVLDKFMTDNIPSSQIVQNAGNGSKVIVASGGNGDTNVVITPPSIPTQGSLSERAGQSLAYQLPANTGIASKSVTVPDSSNDTVIATNYVQSIVSSYIAPTTSDTVLSVQRTSIVNALTNALTNLNDSQNQSGTHVATEIRTIDFWHGSNAVSSTLQNSLALLDSTGTYQGIDSVLGSNNDVLLDAGTSTGAQLFVINLGGISGRTLVLQNIEAAVVASPGTVRAEGSAPIYISSDIQPQNITGSAGNDTLIGTGNDTLTGGAGNDVFGFSGAGKYTVTDFNKAGDSFQIKLAGISNLDDLKAHVTSTVKVGNATTYNLGPDTSITLVGVSAADLTASMFKFIV